jgi:uncharacterized protein YqfA (UPF0365 family)
MENVYELAILDLASERRIEREEYQAAHPELNGHVHPMFAAILNAHAAVPVAVSKALETVGEGA